MNYRMSGYLLGQILVIVAAVLTIPFVLALCLHESDTYLAYGITIGSMLFLGIPLIVKKPKNTEIRARGGFILVAVTWIALSLFGAMPFTISGYIPSFIDSFFETVSGFTTTGSTILTDIEALPKSLLLWRSITHWIGGMGVLVFVIAILPKSNAAIVHLAKAEIPGPQFGKLVSKLRFTARILYGIYIVFTLVEVGCLLLCGMPVFDAFITALGTAGTGGFSNMNASIAAYNSIAIEIVVTVFMFIFSVNLNIFYFVLVGRFRQAFVNEELRWHVSYVAIAILAVTLSLYFAGTYNNFAECLRYSSFQVVSVVSTSGFATADYNNWPFIAQTVLFICMFIGGMAGSTAGGLKVSRVVIITKACGRAIKKASSPRAVINIKMDRHSLDENVVRGAVVYFALYMLVMFISTIALSLAENTTSDFLSGFTAVVTCINNVGPGLGKVGPTGNFGGFNTVGKLILIFDMLAGRLEIYPMLLLFYPKAWQR